MYIPKQWDNWVQKWWFSTHCCQWFQFLRASNRLVIMFSYQQNKTFEDICWALVGRFLQKQLWIVSVFKTILWKAPFNLVLCLLWTCKQIKIMQDLICICKQKTFLTVSSIYIQVKLTVKSFNSKSAKPYMYVLLGTTSLFIF